MVGRAAAHGHSIHCLYAALLDEAAGSGHLLVEPASMCCQLPVHGCCLPMIRPRSTPHANLHDGIPNGGKNSSRSARRPSTSMLHFVRLRALLDGARAHDSLLRSCPSTVAISLSIYRDRYEAHSSSGHEAQTFCPVVVHSWQGKQQQQQQQQLQGEARRYDLIGVRMSRLFPWGQYKELTRAWRASRHERVFDRPQQ